MTKAMSSYNHARIAQDARETYPIQDKGNGLGCSLENVDSVCCDGGRELCAMATSRYFRRSLGQYST